MWHLVKIGHRTLDLRNDCWILVSRHNLWSPGHKSNAKGYLVCLDGMQKGCDKTLMPEEMGMRMGLFRTNRDLIKTMHASLFSLLCKVANVFHNYMHTLHKHMQHKPCSTLNLVPCKEVNMQKINYAEKKRETLNIWIELNRKSRSQHTGERLVLCLCNIRNQPAKAAFSFP